MPGLLAEIVKGERAGVAGHVIACFDDTGLDAARVIARAPVVGIGEAACHLASLVAGRFSIVTTLSRSIPALEHNLVRYGLASRCARVRASDVAVLELEEPHSDARRRIAAEIEAAIRDDRAEAIVLGCAGMADLAEDLSAEYGAAGDRRRLGGGEADRGACRARHRDVEDRRLRAVAGQGLYRARSRRSSTPGEVLSRARPAGRRAP